VGLTAAVHTTTGMSRVSRSILSICRNCQPFPSSWMRKSSTSRSGRSALTRLSSSTISIEKPSVVTR
jgi:hypothetical protein